MAADELSPGTSRSRRSRWLLLVLLLLVLLAAVQTALAARAALSGREALDAALTAARERDMAAMERELREAEQDLGSARGHLRGAGPVLWLARVTPFVRVQVGAGEAVLAAAHSASQAGLSLVPVARSAEADESEGTAGTVAALAAGSPQVHDAVQRLVAARDRVDDYDRYRLLGPLEGLHRDASTRLGEAAEQAVRAEDALTVLLELTGAEGPRRFLLLSQNPDEPRPTGGYMGTYGVLESRQGELELARYDAMGDWHTAHPEAALPRDRVSYPFSYTGEPQSLGNVNVTPDWPTSAELAREVWLAGGEEDVDGVLTYLPGLIARLLVPLGPVEVPSYGETVTAENLDERLEFHTHRQAVRGLPPGIRKEFIAELAEVVLGRLTALPAKQLPDLARALGAGMKAREAAIWSTRPEVQQALGDLRWDGAFRGADGDVFVDAEFAFASKNGRGIRRTFDHQVLLRADGSGVSETLLRIENTQPFEAGYNLGTKSYLTLYGPRGARLAAQSDDTEKLETPLAGHPVAGWLRDAPPLGSDELRVVWEVPLLLVPRSDGDAEYRLTWVPTPGHRGDVLLLDVQLPPGHRWKGDPPPKEVALDGVYSGRWVVTQRSE